MRAQGPASGETELRHIHGVVVDSVTNRPIGRALVVSQDQRLAMMTDSEGRFGFDFRAPVQAARASASSVFVNEAQVQSFYQNLVALVARKPGYLPMTDAGLVSLNDRKADDAELRLTLTPEAIVMGTVAASGAEAPREVTVNLMHRSVQDGLATWVPMQSKQTNSRGEYRFAELPGGAYRVTTQEWMENGVALPAKGHVLMGYPPARSSEGGDTAAGALQVRAGETVQANLDLRAAPYYRVEIAVEGGPPAQGFGVEVRAADGSTGFSLGFNMRSRRLEGFLPNGSYQATIESYGPEPSSAEAMITVAGRPVAASMTVLPRGVTPVVVREEYTAAAADQAGRVTISLGQPGPAQEERPVDVQLASVEDGRRVGLRGFTPGRREALALEGARPGRYRVVVSPHRGYAASVSSGGVDLLHEDLVLGQNGTSAPIEITLRDDGATLTGTVTGLPAGRGAVEPVTLWSSLFCIPTGHDGARVTPAFAGGDGHFRIENLPPGQYRVLAFSHREDNLEYRNEEAMRRFDTKGVLVTVAAGQKAEIEVPVIAREDE